MMKTLQIMGIEGTYLNLVKAIYDKLTANILNDEKLKDRNHMIISIDAEKPLTKFSTHL